MTITHGTCLAAAAAAKHASTWLTTCGLGVPARCQSETAEDPQSAQAQSIVAETTNANIAAKHRCEVSHHRSTLPRPLAGHLDGRTSFPGFHNKNVETKAFSFTTHLQAAQHICPLFLGNDHDVIPACFSVHLHEFPSFH